jgi:hypothetical protein
MYAPYETMTVLARVDSEPMWRAYERIEADHSETMFLWEPPHREAFAHTVMGWLATNDRIAFHTDDDIFYATATLPPAVAEHDDVFTMRLGKNTTYCHPADREQQVPDPFWQWRWKDGDGDFGYPLSLNGTIYNSADLLPLLDFDFANPTDLEAGLAARADRFGPQWMKAGAHSCVVSLPHNRVSMSGGARAGSNPAWTPQALLDLYLDGYRIDLDQMDFSNITAAHQEVPLAFHRP